jgi:hypothetical protein
VRKGIDKVPLSVMLPSVIGTIVFCAMVNTYMNYSQALSCTSQVMSQNFIPKKENVIQKEATKIRIFMDENWQRVWVVFLWTSTHCTNSFLIHFSHCCMTL